MAGPVMTSDVILASAPAHHVDGHDDRLRGEAGDRAADAVADRCRLRRRQLRALAETPARRLHHLQCCQVHLRSFESTCSGPGTVRSTETCTRELLYRFVETSSLQWKQTPEFYMEQSLRRSFVQMLSPLLFDMLSSNVGVPANMRE